MGHSQPPDRNRGLRQHSLLVLQFTTPSICCGDFDGYYHIKLSEVIWESLRNAEFPPIFTWLPLTTLNARDYADQHLLFHLLLVPFTWFGNLTGGAKIAVVLFSTLAVLSCYWLLLRFRVQYAFLFLLALTACASDFSSPEHGPAAQEFIIITCWLLLHGPF